MSGIEATEAIALLAIFLGGVVSGVIVLVSLAIKREDRRLSLSRAETGFVTRGARVLTGVGSRGERIWER